MSVRRIVRTSSPGSTDPPSATSAPAAFTTLIVLRPGSRFSVKVVTISSGDPTTVAASAGVTVESSAWPRTALGDAIRTIETMDRAAASREVRRGFIEASVGGGRGRRRRAVRPGPMGRPARPESPRSSPIRELNLVNESPQDYNSVNREPETRLKTRICRRQLTKARSSVAQRARGAVRVPGGLVGQVPFRERDRIKRQAGTSGRAVLAAAGRSLLEGQRPNPPGQAARASPSKPSSHGWAARATVAGAGGP